MNILDFCKIKTIRELSPLELRLFIDLIGLSNNLIIEKFLIINYLNSNKKDFPNSLNSKASMQKALNLLESKKLIKRENKKITIFLPKK